MLTTTGAIITILLAACLSLALTVFVEAHADRLGLVRAPNARSSHTRLTPRGGGLGLVLASSMLMLVLGILASVELAMVALLGAVVGAIGFVDDIVDLSASRRIAVQLACAVALVTAQALLDRSFANLELTLLFYMTVVVAIVAGVWWINLYNFMDGIDGIAASQAVLILLGGSILTGASYQGDDKAALLVAMLGTAAATGGFLIRNFPPAKVFMGDVASTYLAFILFAFCLITAPGGIAIPAWVILGAAFASDATTTLIRRVARGEQPTQAHRRHAYQQLSRLWGHRRVTLAYAAITLVWCFPLAALAQWVGAWGSWAVAVLAYLPLVGLCLALGGGSRTETAASV